MEPALSFGQMYRLVKATAAVLRNAGQRKCQVLPEGSIVLLKDSPAANGRVNIRFENHELWMFAADLNQRGVLVLNAGGTPHRTRRLSLLAQLALANGQLRQTGIVGHKSIQSERHRS